MTDEPNRPDAGNGRPDPAEHFRAFFTYAHLPVHLQGVSGQFATLYDTMMVALPPGPEKTAAMRKLLEAKDCAVRAAL